VDEDVPAAKPALKVVTPADDFDDEPAVATAPVQAKASGQNAQDILAMIRNRQKS
jgi:hypothetical protein